MAQTWQAKAPTEVVERRWTVPLAEGDAISTVSASASGVTVSATDHDFTDAVITLSGGTAPDVGAVTITVTTGNGLTLAETFLIAVESASQQFTYTVRDVVYFALRKVAGIGNDPEAGEADDALERFNDMVAMWRIDGLDIGVQGPLTLGDTLEIADEYIAALKFNLRVSCHDHYDVPVTATDAGNAEAGRRLIANRLLAIGDLSFSPTLARPADSVASLF